jgi:hypothetical protein
MYDGTSMILTNLKRKNKIVTWNNNSLWSNTYNNQKKLNPKNQIMKIWFSAFLMGDGSHHFERWQEKNEAEESLTQKHNGRLTDIQNGKK